MTAISRTLLVGFAALIGLMGWVDGVSPAPVRDIDLIAPAGPEWLHVNGTVQGTRYSTLSQINTINVRQLRPRLAIQYGWRQLSSSHTCLS